MIISPAFDMASSTPGEKGEELLRVLSNWPANMDEEQALLLIKAGANIKLHSEHGGDTALHKAAIYGHTQVAHELLKAGADPKALDWLLAPPVFYAASGGFTEIFDALLPLVEDINIRNAENENLLWGAADQGLTEIARRLVEKGIELDVPNREGITPLQRARHQGWPETAQLIEDAIAKPAREARERHEKAMAQINDHFRHGIVDEQEAPQTARFAAKKLNLF